MNVIVKNMEMPKNCGECPFIFSSWGIEYYCHLAESSTSAEYVGREKMTNCPLIELPPHGDLVDLSDMIHPNDSMRHMTIDEQLRRTCEGWSTDKKQYVVIEAEGSET